MRRGGTCAAAHARACGAATASAVASAHPRLRSRQLAPRRYDGGMQYRRGGDTRGAGASEGPASACNHGSTVQRWRRVPGGSPLFSIACTIHALTVRGVRQVDRRAYVRVFPTMPRVTVEILGLPAHALQGQVFRCVLLPLLLLWHVREWHATPSSAWQVPAASSQPRTAACPRRPSRRVAPGLLCSRSSCTCCAGWAGHDRRCSGSSGAWTRCVGVGGYGGEQWRGCGGPVGWWRSF